MTLELLIFIGGVLHFGILLASALIPVVLDWRESLKKLDRLSQQLVWVHGAFIVLVIVGFGLISTLFAGELAAGTSLARGVCGFIGFFWGARLFVQFFVFDSKPFLTNIWLKLGENGLTLVFLYHTVVYLLAAFGPSSGA
jgi:hypothetical protein